MFPPFPAVPNQRFPAVPNQVPNQFPGPQKPPPPQQGYASEPSNMRNENPVPPFNGNNAYYQPAPHPIPSNPPTFFAPPAPQPLQREPSNMRNENPVPPFNGNNAYYQPAPHPIPSNPPTFFAPPASQPLQREPSNMRNENPVPPFNGNNAYYQPAPHPIPSNPPTFFAPPASQPLPSIAHPAPDFQQNRYDNRMQSPQMNYVPSNPPTYFAPPTPQLLPNQPDFQQNRYDNRMQSPQPRFLDLMVERNLLGFDAEDNQFELPQVVVNPEVHCSPSIFRSTMSAVPESQELLNKCRLPLGLTLQPFRDLKNLTVIQTNIVRCRYCRTYINPYVYMPDSRRWKCNLCYRVNDLPEEFTWDPQSRTFGDPCRRPEIQQPTIEYIAPSEYMLRAPQPVLYLFILDVSSTAVDCGYLHNFSEQFLINIDQMPGDDRTLIGFIGVDAAIHFFQFNDPSAPPKHLVAYDIEEPFAPVSTGLVVELVKYKESVRSFVQNLPTFFETNSCSSNCLGAALTIGRDLIQEIGGRMTVMLASIPNIGPGALNVSQDANAKGSKLNFATSTDFYKRLALECTGKQIAVDLFVMGERHVDIATLSEVVKFSTGSVYHFPHYHFIREQTEVKRFQKLLNRYLTRKLGLEAVLRIRCSKGLSLHTFHGNFFVRSTDLLAMANVNPDCAIGVQVQLEEPLTDQPTVCFQAALLYTSSRGDRRIRVHTLCLPVISDFSRVFHYFDIKATVSMLAKMAADRAMNGGDLSDCREALINAATDALATYNRSVGQRPTSILVPVEGHLKFLALYVLGLLKNRAFSSAVQSVNIDQKVAAMLLFKTAPIEVIMLEICPALYSVHNIEECAENPQRLPLSYERVNRDGVYLLDTGSYVYMYVCSAVQPRILEGFFGINSYSRLDEDVSLKQLENPLSERLHSFLRHLHVSRGLGTFAPVMIIREDSPRRDLFTKRLVEDRTESSHSYVEFLQHLKREISAN